MWFLEGREAHTLTYIISSILSASNVSSSTSSFHLQTKGFNERLCVNLCTHSIHGKKSFLYFFIWGARACFESRTQPTTTTWTPFMVGQVEKRICGQNKLKRSARASLQTAFSFSLYHCDEERLLPMTVNLLMTALWSSSSSSYSSSSYYFIIIKKPCSIVSAISFVLNAEHSNESPLIEVSFG